MWKFNWGVFWAVLAAVLPLGIAATAVTYKLLKEIHTHLVSIDSAIRELRSAVMKSSILGI